MNGHELHPERLAEVRRENRLEAECDVKDQLIEIQANHIEKLEDLLQWMRNELLKLKGVTDKMLDDAALAGLGTGPKGTTPTS